MCNCGSCVQCEDREVAEFVRTDQMRKEHFNGRSKEGAPLTVDEQDYRVLFGRARRVLTPLLQRGTLANGQPKLINLGQDLGPLVRLAAEKMGNKPLSSFIEKIPGTTAHAEAMSDERYEF